MSKFYRVKDLIARLQEFDEDLPLVVTREGKDHQFGVSEDDIYIIENAYFADSATDKALYPKNYDEDIHGLVQFLNIGTT